MTNTVRRVTFIVASKPNVVSVQQTVDGFAHSTLASSDAVVAWAMSTDVAEPVESLADVKKLIDVLFERLTTSSSWIVDALRDTPEAWFPVVEVDAPISLEGVDAVVHSRPSVSYRADWDAAVVAAEREHQDRLVRATGLCLAQWTALRWSAEAARSAILVAGQSDTSGDLLDQELERLRSTQLGLAVASVALDARIGLYYKYESDFVEALRSTWMIDELDRVAERSSEAVGALIERRVRELELDGRLEQQRQARRASAWLFAISAASGITATLYAFDFAVSEAAMSVSVIWRAVIAIAAAVLAAAVAIRYRDSS